MIMMMITLGMIMITITLGLLQINNYAMLYFVNDSHYKSILSMMIIMIIVEDLKHFL
mgnify:FL=1